MNKCQDKTRRGTPYDSWKLGENAIRFTGGFRCRESLTKERASTASGVPGLMCARVEYEFRVILEPKFYRWVFLAGGLLSRHG